MDIEEAKNRCNELVKVEHANWVGISNQEAINVLLNELDNKDKENAILRQGLEENTQEIDKKDKIINEMAKWIEKHTGYAIDETLYKESKEYIIDYFTKKVTEEEEK